jgi:hypothetical protein
MRETKRITMENKTQRNDHDLSQRMTGMESLRVLKLCLERWSKLSGNEYMTWLADEADCDPGIWSDWCNAISDMIKEREEKQFELHAYKVSGAVYHPCECQDKDSWTPAPQRPEK